MSVFWIVLLSIVGSLELFGIGLVIYDMVYYGWKDRKKVFQTANHKKVEKCQIL